MSSRTTTALAVAALGLLLSLPFEASSAAAPVSPSDSLHSSPHPRASALRAAYRNAWALRQAGEFVTALDLCESTLDQMGLALEDPEAPRRDLVELRARVRGLCEAIRHDIDERARSKQDGGGIHEAGLLGPIEVQVNPDVERWIDYYTGRGRSVFERWLKRSGRYVDLFRTVLQREGLPPDLVHLVFVESGFNLYARSHAAAVGPWQFIRSTARIFGLTVNRWIDERKDPEKATVAAARYLKYLFATFGDWPLALAAYNAGEGAVLRAIRRQGTTNYWDLRLRRETEQYVPQFMAVLKISREPEEFGFHQVELEPPISFDEVALQGAVDLRGLAELAGCSVMELRELNPAVLHHAAQGSGGVTTLRVPAGRGEVLVGRLEDGAQLPATRVTLQHKVRAGETLGRIAERYHVGVQQLAAANHMKTSSILVVGRVLNVPSSRATSGPELYQGDDPRASTSYVPERNIALRDSLVGNSNPEGRMTVRVGRGETLGVIAQRYGVTVRDLRRWNHLKSNRIRPGSYLKVRMDAAPDSAALAHADDGADEEEALESPTREELRARVVVVKRGDTLSTIALRHGVSVAEIQRVNGLRSTQIRVGQKLKVPAG